MLASYSFDSEMELSFGNVPLTTNLMDIKIEMFYFCPTRTLVRASRHALPTKNEMGCGW